MLKGRTALITGSTSGIGQGIAEALAAEGVNIVLNGFGAAAEVEALRAGMAAAHGVEVLHDPADMTRPQTVEAMMQAAIARFGSIDILVNNAGIQHVAPVDEFPVEKWDAILAINLSSAFHTSRLALPGMKKKGWGRIINISSAHGLVASPNKSAYVAAKHGIVGFTKSLALEVAEQGITVNAICPGYVWTGLVERQIPDLARTRGVSEDEVKRTLLATQPTRKFIAIAEVAALAVFLAGEAAASITGAQLPIDGGWTAQ